MFIVEPAYTAMECRINSEDRNEAGGTYLLEDKEIDHDSEDEDFPAEVSIPGHQPVRSIRCILGVTMAAVFVVGVAVAILVLVVTALTTPPRDASMAATPVPPVRFPHPVVIPECGDIANSVVCLGAESDDCRTMFVGSREDGVYVFKGIPYAHPPTFKRRWKSPVPLEANCSAPMYVQSFGNRCSQLNNDNGKLEGSEDCLFLNIWTPRLDINANLHVMVYFHGGGLISGSGHENGSLPTPGLVRSADMVFVTFNYRLNAFGFMAVEALEANGAAGNYGFMDQILVLRWIQSNIGAFGGNPDKVTVFGQGSGATSIYALLASELASNLFHKAWLASPSPKLESHLSEAYRQNVNFIHNVSCGSGTLDEQLSCLQKLPAEQILLALPWKMWRNLHFFRLPLKTEQSTVIAVIDGFVLKTSPLDAWKKRKFNDVHLLIGNTAQETDVYPTISSLVEWSKYDDYVYQLMLPFDHTNVSDILAMYGHQLTPEHSIATLVSDMRVICPIDELVKVAASAARKPIYRYVSSFYADHKLGLSVLQKNYAYSGVDVDAFFNAEPVMFVRSGFPGIMRDVVFRFVRNGTVYNWNTFPHSTYNLSGIVERIAPYFQSSRCNYWRTNWFFPTYAWMN